MLLTVNKQIEETLEIKTPCYYKGATGWHHISEAGELIQVSDRIINMWSSSDGKYLANAIQQMLTLSQPCKKEEFEKAYAEVSAKLNTAVGLIKQQQIEELENLLQRAKQCNPEYIVEIISERIDELKKSVANELAG